MKFWMTLSALMLTCLSLLVTGFTHEEVSDLHDHLEVCHSAGSSSCCLLPPPSIFIPLPITNALPLFDIVAPEPIQLSILEKPPRFSI